MRRLLILAFISFNSLTGYSAILPDTIRTDAGLVSGTRTSDGQVKIFRGIPFAAPPVGDLRWKPPVAVSSWQGVRECKAFGPSPMQNKPTPFGVYTSEFLIPAEPIGEDCLYLNVWTAAKNKKEKRPVIVWIYGGGFVSGGAGCPIYDGESMSRKGIVFVSVNYRVGVFGFFAHPELTSESTTHSSGNYALMDQLAALEWVKRNISAFGGDPGNVTIAGQSAGSMAVTCLMASPRGKGLFHRAIAESGANFLQTPMMQSRTLADAEKDGAKFASDLGAASIADLRKVSAEELLKKVQGLRGPIVDGYILPEAAGDIFRKQQHNKVPLLTGWNEDDGFLFGQAKTAEQFVADARQRFGAEADQYLKYYPASSDAEAEQSQVRVSRDMLFGSQNYSMANALANQKTDVFVYFFTRKVPATEAYRKYGAFHTGEVPYAYDNLKFLDRPLEPADQKLASAMSQYWCNFAKSGNPNGKGLTSWPKYDSQKATVMIFDAESRVASHPTKDAIDFQLSKMKK